MGLQLTRIGRGGTSQDSDSSVNSSLSPGCSGTNKRKLSSYVEDGFSRSSPTTPVGKRMRTTAQYIHQTLFVEGENNDISIIALGHEWKLHKVYLCQANYFKSMFHGNWVESNKSEIHIEIVDEVINKEALDITFSSFYSDEIDMEKLVKNLIPVTAAAYMVQLDGLIEHCQILMLELLSAENVCSFHEAACRYGITEVEKRCFEWLQRNLLLTRTPVVTKDLSFELLQKVISSPDLVVMQVEIDLYNLIKIWVYLRINPDTSASLQNLVEKTQEYFFDRNKEGIRCAPFLCTELGLQYAKLFRLLRLDHLLEDQKGIALIEKDNIIPEEWLLPVYKDQWRKLLCVHDASDPGPLDIDEEVFEEHACRCGRILERDIRYCWRWTGFSFGIDIILFYNPSTRRLVLKRNTFCQACNSTVCMQSKRAVAVRFKLFTTDSAGHVKNCVKTDMMRYNLSTDEEVLLFTLDDTWTFPIFVSARILITSPFEGKTRS